MLWSRRVVIPLTSRGWFRRCYLAMPHGLRGALRRRLASDVDRIGAMRPAEH